MIRRLAIMQPYLFPYLGYYQLMAAVDRFMLLDDVNFIKRGWVNRNRILVQGKEHIFTLPVTAASQNRRINDLALHEYPRWRSRFFNTLQRAYARSDHFASAMDILDYALPQEAESLQEVLGHSLISISRTLGIDTEIICTSQVDPEPQQRGSERILALCRENATREYLNLPGAGRDLYDPADFATAGIRLRFLQPVIQAYPQQAETFVPRLSLVDIIMNNSIDEIQTLLAAFTLDDGGQAVKGEQNGTGDSQRPRRSLRHDTGEFQRTLCHAGS